MNQAQQLTYHRQYDRWLRQQDRKAVRIVLVGMGQIMDSLRKVLDSVGPNGVQSLIDVLVLPSVHERILEKIYTATGVAAAEREYNRLIPPAKAQGIALLTKDRDVPELPQPPKPSGLIRIDHNSEVWRQRMVALARSAETASRIEKLTTKTRQLVRDVLSKGASERWALPKLVKNLRGVVLDKVRATLIARTETTRAANAGHVAGAETTLLPLKKIWIATRDARTRVTHILAGQQPPVDKNKPFMVGGKPMQYPGDPAGGPEEVCNCRCVIAHVPATNEFD